MVDQCNWQQDLCHFPFNIKLRNLRSLFLTFWMRKSKRHANTSSRFYLIISRLKQFLHIWNSQYKRKENILNTFSLIISSSISLISLRMAIALILEYLTILLCMHIYIYIARTKCKMCHQWITVSCIKMIVFFFG